MNLTRRWILLTAAVGACALTAAGHHDAQAAGSVKFASVTLDKSTLKASGGQVNVTVQLEPNGNTINRVAAKPSLPSNASAFGPEATLSALSKKKFRGTVTIAPNTRNTAVFVDIYVTVDHSGGRLGPAKKARVKLKAGSGGGGDTPPPPPPI